jgi:hypothetical protein
MVWIPKGLWARIFAALTETVALSYKVTEYYSPKEERTVLWNDPALGIDWKVAREDAILSAKDRLGLPLASRLRFSLDAGGCCCWALAGSWECSWHESWLARRN